MVSELEPNLFPVVMSQNMSFSYGSNVTLRLVRQTYVDKAYWENPSMEEQKKNKMEGRISSWHRKLTRYQNYQSDWMEQMRGTLMLVSTVIATMSFQVAINPPGGVWQSDSNTRMGCVPNTTCKAGTSVIAFGSSDQKNDKKT
ncbi:hypothetical protein Lal_00032443 [Lupinus albus]|nr:hypothetical protein Lal_00032443 [Lupinus albus]